MRPFQVLAAMAGFLTLSTAWSGADLLEGSADKAVRGIEGIEGLFRRQLDTAGMLVMYKNMRR